MDIVFFDRCPQSIAQRVWILLSVLLAPTAICIEVVTASSSEHMAADTNMDKSTSKKSQLNAQYVYIIIMIGLTSVHLIDIFILGVGSW